MQLIFVMNGKEKFENNRMDTFFVLDSITSSGEELKSTYKGIPARNVR